MEIAAGIVALVAAIVSIGLDAGIGNVVKDLENAQMELDDYTYDLAQISILKSGIDQLNDSVNAAIQSIQDISRLWEDLETALSDLSAKLHNEEVHIDKSEFSEMLNDIKNSQSDWDAIVEVAKQVRLLELKPDMKAEPVKINFNNRKSAV